MKRDTPAQDPNAYVSGLKGWQRDVVALLRKSVCRAPLAEEIKWGHLVYSAGGPVLFIRAEANRVLFGFWRGQRLGEIEPRLQAKGRYEMATMQLYENTRMAQATARRLAKAAMALNQELGDPRLAATRKK